MVTLRLGTRRSALALAQAEWVAQRLEAVAGVRVELVPRSTRGDRERGPLAPLGGKGLFTAELEAGLADGSLDLAVHSLKDLPVELPEGLVLAAYPERADPRDALVGEVADDGAAGDLAGLPAGSLLLTGSLRRRAQILALRPELEVRALRGNVDTRLGTLERLASAEQRPVAAVLAMAGLARLGIAGPRIHPLDPAVMLPAPGQGTLAIEVRAGSGAEAACSRLDHPPTARAAEAERRVVAALGGSCVLPLAAWARPEDAGRLRLSALLATPDGRRTARGEVVAATPAAAAEAVVAALRSDGADAVLAVLAALAAPDAAPGPPP